MSADLQLRLVSWLRATETEITDGPLWLGKVFSFVACFKFLTDNYRYIKNKKSSHISDEVMKNS